jgi:rhamnosyltransferase
MATFNGSRWIDEQLNSIFSQLDVEVSVIVNDDCSSDDTLDKLNSWKERGFRLQILENDSSRNGLPGSFLEFLSHEVDTDFVAFSDQDDIWLPSHLRNSIEHLGRSGYGCVSSGRFVCEKNKIDSGILDLPDLNFFNWQNALVENQAYGNTLVMTSNFFSSLQTLQDVSAKDCVMHDSLIYLWGCVNSKITFIPHANVRYRIHDSNATGIPRLRFRGLVASQKLYLRQSALLLSKLEGDSSLKEIRSAIYEHVQGCTSRNFWVRLRYSLSPIFLRKKKRDQFIVLIFILFGLLR